MAAATDGGTAVAAAIITGGEGAVAITMAGAATIVGESQPGPLIAALFIRRPDGEKPSLAYAKLLADVPRDRVFSGRVFSADIWQAALSLSPGTPLAFEQKPFLSPRQAAKRHEERFKKA